MKIKAIFSIITVLTIFLSACDKDSNKHEVVGKKPYSPIEGNWELVSNEVSGKKIIPKRPEQFKIFNEGYFCFIMYDSLGNFYKAGAGPYEVNGNMYKETVNYYSDTKFIGTSDWQQWEMKGDTLIFYGFKKVTMADGSDVTDALGRDNFIEKRVRVKK